MPSNKISISNNYHLFPLAMHESLVHALYDKLNWVNFVLPFEIKSIVSNIYVSLWPATGKDTIC